MSSSCTFWQEATGTNGPAYYTHLITLGITLFFAFGVTLYAEKKSKTSAKIFTAFAFLLGFWLISSLITWVGSDYHLISFFWSLLDLTNILFFAVGTLLVLQVSLPTKVGWPVTLGLLSLSIPAFWLTATGQSVTGFYQPVCEAYGSEWLPQYKLFVEIAYTAIALFAVSLSTLRTKDADRRAEVLLIGLPMALFFLVFGITEYYSSVTGIYEVNLYSLFAAPVLFAPIVYSMLRYQVAKFATVGVRLISLVAVGLIAVQFFFIQNKTNFIINGVTLVLVAIFSGVLIRSARREAKLRERAEALSKNLEIANLRLLELDKQKTEFVSLASHQLRGPLTAIKGYASMLNEGDYGALPMSAMEILGRIQKSAHDMAILITDYLDVTRIELGKVKYAPERFSLRDLLSEVEKELLPNTPKDLTLTIEEGADPRFVFADRNKIKQVIGNLIDNSVKYTPKGAVTVSLTRREGYARIEVKDNGVGINKSSLPQLFQKFARAQNASKSNIKGTGLGLYIAKTIADYHRGHISAASEGEGKGSTFIFELPLADEQSPSVKAA